MFLERGYFQPLLGANVLGNEGLRLGTVPRGAIHVR